MTYTSLHRLTAFKALCSWLGLQHQVVSDQTTSDALTDMNLDGCLSLKYSFSCSRPYLPFSLCLLIEATSNKDKHGKFFSFCRMNIYSGHNKVF